jgi:four helix bundle protein
MQDPENLKVWKKSHRLTLDVFRATDDPSFPRRWPLINQIQSSVLSVESNIVEGATRGGDAEFLRFARYALSSAFELRTQLRVAAELGYLAPAHYQRHRILIKEVRKMLWSLIETLQRSLRQGP